MNLFKFLKNSSGKMTVTGMVVMGAVGTALVWSAADTAKVAVNPMQDRGNFLGTYSEPDRSIYDSGITGRNGVRSFSNTYNGGIRVGAPATNPGDDIELAERFQGAVEGAVGNALPTQGAAFNNANPDFEDVTPNPTVPGGVYAPSIGGGNGAGGGDGGGGVNPSGTTANNLPPAGMATANGGGSVHNGGTTSPIPGNRGGENGAGGGNSGGNVGNGEGYTLSGGMPTHGDGLLAGLPKHNNPNFGNSNRYGPNGRRSGIDASGNDLRAIAKYTGKVKDAVKRGDMISENKLAGGFFGETKVETTNGLSYVDGSEDDSPDFNLPEVPEAGNGNGGGNPPNPMNEHLKDLAKSKKSLAIQLLAMLGVGVAMGATVYFLIKAGKAKLGTPAFAIGEAMIIAGMSLATIYMAYALAYIAVCGRFAHKWGNEAGSLPVSGIILCVTAALMMKSVVASALNGLCATDKASSALGGFLKFSQFGSFFGPVAMPIGMSKIGEVFSTANTNPDKIK